MVLGIGIESQQIVRVSAALAAAGAFDAAPLELYVNGAQNAMLALTYTRGGAAGAFDMQIEISIYSVVGNVPAGAQEWVDGTAYAVGAVAAGANTTSLLQAERVRFTPLTANVEGTIFGPLELDGLIERIRIGCAESGNVGAPGTLQITLLAY